MRATWIRRGLVATGLVLGAALAGCGGEESEAAGAADTEERGAGRPEESGGGAVKAAPAVATGDAVLARWAGASYYEGKITAVGDGRATVAWADGSAPSEVGLEEIVPRAGVGGAGEVPRAGTPVLARWASSWYLGEVTGAKDGRAEVRYERDGTSGEVEPKDLRVLAADEAARLRAGAPKGAAAAPSGSAGGSAPAAAAGYAPRKGDAVLAEWTGGSWYPGTVERVEAGGEVVVAWADGSTPSAVGPGRLGPRPDARTAKAPVKNAKVLVRPAGSETAKWERGLVEAVRGTEVEVKTDAGATRTAAFHDVIEMK